MLTTFTCYNVARKGGGLYYYIQLAGKARQLECFDHVRACI